MIRRVVRMYEYIETGPLYDKAVQLMATYRSIAARMENAKAGTQGKLDRQLERLNERIGARLSELTNPELSALTCWKDSIVPGAYEVDHAEITAKPYISIRKIDRWDEVRDVDEEKSITIETLNELEKQELSAQLQAFLTVSYEP